MGRTLDIGEINEPLFVFGGVYSNLEALVAVKALSEKLGFRPKQIICTGDVVAYCADPSASLDFVKEWGIHCIAGNVELNLRDEADECGCNFNEGSRCDMLSRQWYPYAKAHVTQENLAYIHSLPEFIDCLFYGKKTKVVHGSFHNTSEFIFHSSKDSIFERNFMETGCEIILAGHCGLPFEKRLSKGYWVNAGVIGMPANDGNSYTWCGGLGLTQNMPSFEFMKLSYDHELAASKMGKEGLPASYAETLLTGIWDNCDILPEVETARQGKDIEL